MSSMQQMLLAGGSRMVVDVTTAGSSGFLGYGANSPAFGSISVVSGSLSHIINRLASSPGGSFDFQVILSAISPPPLDAFVGVRVTDQSNVVRTYLVSAASSSTGGTTRSWTWGDSSDDVWTSAGITRRVEFF